MHVSVNVKKNSRKEQVSTKRRNLAAEIGTKRLETKQTYNRYIQKKFSPKIFWKMITQLSEEQISWVNETGFGHVLGMKMKSYAHKLGYIVVESFNRSECAIVLDQGSIVLTDDVVNRVLGLPKGDDPVEIKECKNLLLAWVSQFPKRSHFNVTASLIVKKIRSSEKATYLFKLNFLVLLSNFLVESNHNGYVKTEILGFCGEIDKCYKYNWCGFVINKLLSTHEFWDDNRSGHHFTGSLPLLTVS